MANTMPPLVVLVALLVEPSVLKQALEETQKALDQESAENQITMNNRESKNL